MAMQAGNNILLDADVQNINIMPSIMIADWSHLSLRYSALTWLEKNIEGYNITKDKSFVEKYELSNNELNHFVERLSATLVKERSAPKNIWQEVDYDNFQDVDNNRILIREFLTSKPSSDFMDIAKCCLTILPQPFTDGIAGYVFEHQRAIAHRLDDEQFDPYPSELPKTRETDSIGYKLMQYIERNWPRSLRCGFP